MQWVLDESRGCLFGAFGAADAFYAPVATRLHSYGVAFEGAAAAYRDALLAWPDLVAWTEAAQAEPWVIETDTKGL